MLVQIFKNSIRVLGSKAFRLLFVAFFVVFIVSGSTKLYAFLNYSTEYFSAIKQPIAFNHKVHVTDNQISCEACHTQARFSSSAGTPSVESCIGCHILVKGTTDTQKREIAKINNYWKNNQPIPWKKVHDVPDFVNFKHNAHIDVGFDCSSCHGEVAKTVMPVPQSFKDTVPLSMGWCVTCHRTDWPVDITGKVSIPVREVRGGTIVSEPRPAVGIINGPVDCLACHK